MKYSIYVYKYNGTPNGINGINIPNIQQSKVDVSIITLFLNENIAKYSNLRQWEEFSDL